MLHVLTNLELYNDIMLVFTLMFVLIYEAINGFHDTASALATIIYTRALGSHLAVIMSGVFNFLGVLMGGLNVAYAIVHLLPIDLLINISSTHSLVMIFSMLLAAILWNLSTWYFGLPASSSHTLIGAIIGIGLTNALVSESSLVSALNIPKLIEIFLSLIISPLIGLILASTIVFFLQHYWNNEKSSYIHLTPMELEKENNEHKPPLWTRIALIFSAAGVSFSHGANDGQKGIGLIMLLLIGVAPAGFIVNMNASSYDIIRTRNAVNNLQQYYIGHPNVFINIFNSNKVTTLPLSTVTTTSLPSLYIESFNNLVIPSKEKNLSTINDQIMNQKPITKFNSELPFVLFATNRISLLLDNLDSYEKLDVNQRLQVQHLLIYIADIADKASKLSEIPTIDKDFLLKLRRDLLNTVEYAPMWTTISVALALSLGTMVGWRRVAKTIIEKIGKKGMTYAQGLSAQVTAAISIGIASYTGILVSTTHVLSSAVTGTMIATGDGIHIKTVKSILLAWVLTLPVTIILASSFYWIALKLI